MIISPVLYAEKIKEAEPEWIYKGKFDTGTDFKDGMARIQVGFNERAVYGFINDSGKLIVPVKYHSATEFENGYARAGFNSGMGLIDRDGRIVLQLKYTEAAYSGTGKTAIVADKAFNYALIDFSGREITPYKYQEIRKFNSGLALVKLKSRYGYIDSTGTEVIPCTYHDADSFYDDIARVSKNGRTGYIDTSGREIIPLIFDKGENCVNNIIIVAKDGKSGCIDRTGKELTPFKYHSISSFKNGFARVTIRKDDRTYLSGIIDSNGKEIIPAEYEDAAYTFSDGLAYVKKNGLYGYVNTSNKTVIPFIYKTAWDFSEERACVKKTLKNNDNKTGYIDKSGKEITEFEYTTSGSFKNGRAVVGDGSRFGYIDINGREITPMIYDGYSDDFYEGYALVMKDGACGFIDITGKEVIRQQKNCTARSFKNGFALIHLRGFAGYIRRPDNR